MKKIIALTATLLISLASFAQTDRYFYEDDFDWRWDIRVRISDGIRTGRLTNREADRLFNRLEKIENREFLYTRDGVFSAWEQDEIWDDIMDIHDKIGFELNDWDRDFYGYSRPGYAFRGTFRWYGRNYNFRRFDRPGYGSLRLGYSSRNYIPPPACTYRNYYDRNFNNREFRRNYERRPRGRVGAVPNTDRPSERNREDRNDNRPSNSSRESRSDRSNERNSSSSDNNSRGSRSNREYNNKSSESPSRSNRSENERNPSGNTSSRGSRSNRENNSKSSERPSRSNRTQDVEIRNRSNSNEEVN
ncbi:MAG: hypothetical protein ACRCVT_02275 [Leadbetterella sp.]